MEYAPVIPTDTEDVLDTYVATKYPQLGFIMASVYLILVKMILPKYMQDKQPYNLNTVLRIYDLVQVYFNIALVCKFIQSNIFWSFWEVHCVPVTPEHPYYIDVGDIAVSYVYLKVIDLLDTVFIVLKKKTNQLTFLHLLHHSMTLSIAYISFSDKEKFGVPLAIVNCFTHIVMYFYYFVASFESQKWVYKYKRYVTTVQLSQFAIAFVYLAYGFTRGCPLGRRSKILWCIIIAAMSYQFSKFYYLNYVKDRNKSS